MKGRGCISNSAIWQESLVVVLIVGRVMVSLFQASSFNEAKGLLFLTGCSLVVEMVSKGGSNLRHLNLRWTQAPGIPIGAVTLPIVMASRLMQVLRGPYESQAGLDRARVDYWSSIACSFALLLILTSSTVLKREEKGGSKQNGSREKHNENGRKRRDHVGKDGSFSSDYRHKFLGYQISGPVAAISLLALMLVSQLGFLLGTWGLIWCLGVAIGNAYLFHFILQAFSSSTSAGESMLVAHGLSLYIGNITSYTLSNLVVGKNWPEDTVPVRKEPIDAIVHAIVLGFLFVPVFYSYLLKLNSLSLKALELTEEKGAISEAVPRAAIFYFAILCVILWGAPAWLGSVAKISQHPILWLLQYVLDDPRQRLGLCVYWILAITLFSLFLHQMAVKKQVARIMVRKGFHLMAVFMFVPALAFQPGFLRLSFALAFGVFVIIETMRIWRIPPLGDRIHSFMKAFTDSRDSDVLIISHFSLLLGCAIPVWLSSTDSLDSPLAAYAGILSLGIGDTMASVIGYNYGSMRLSSSSKKTWEGTISGILSTIGASILLLLYLSAKIPTARHLGSLAVAATGAGLVEAFTSQLDNAFVPIIFQALLAL